jgi:alpha-glucosidase
MLIYINPFLSNEPGHNALFTEAQRLGYLVRRRDDSPYLIKNTNFWAGMLDLSNPQARTWIKEVIKKELIGKAGASGWTADFGEALPFDSKLSGGADPGVWHNRYTEEWARVNREAIEEAGRGSDITFFSRSGFAKSPGISTLFWLGDQLQTWDEYDGIKSAVVGVLSGGISGFSLLHTDAGGYGALSVPYEGKKIPVIARSPELLMRWFELNAFTAVFRTHERLDPAISARFDTNSETMAHLARCARIYQGLAAYRKRVVKEAAQRGYPVVRHPFLHFPEDPNTYQIRYQFMLGPDMMVAPVVDKGAAAANVYFLKGSEWIDLWTGRAAGRAGIYMQMPAPLGKPAVFLRKGGASLGTIMQGLRGAGVLT